jgi:3-carboxy-cis,cis-muconate cycloisomerase
MSASSSGSEPGGAWEPLYAGLFDGVQARGAVPAEVADGAWLRALLEVEAALALAQADAGTLTAGAARAVADACAAGGFDMVALGERARRAGNPVPALVEALRAAAGPAAAHAVHAGATSQDILDTAAMLVAHRALEPLLSDLRGAARAAAGLARRYRDTVLAGRTLLRQAVPVTFGLKTAGWLVGLDEAAAVLARIRGTRLAVQVGGAAGTLAGYGPAGPDLPGLLAARLGLATPVLPWHATRNRVAELGAALGVAAGAVAKPARDVALLSQTEVGEVTEGEPGISSAMPHKRNPVAAVCAAGCAAQAPGLVATLLAAMAQEHERAAGGWHAEWRALRELFVATGSAAAWLRDCLEHLRVRPEMMRHNLHRPDGFGPGDPAPHLVHAGFLVDRALAAHDAAGPETGGHDG